MPKYTVRVEITEEYEVEAESEEDACLMEVNGEAGSPTSLVVGARCAQVIND